MLHCLYSKLQCIYLYLSRNQSCSFKLNAHERKVHLAWCVAILHPRLKVIQSSQQLIYSLLMEYPYIKEMDWKRKKVEVFNRLLVHLQFYIADDLKRKKKTMSGNEKSLKHFLQQRWPKCWLRPWISSQQEHQCCYYWIAGEQRKTKVEISCLSGSCEFKVVLNVGRQLALRTVPLLHSCCCCFMTNLRAELWKWFAEIFQPHLQKCVNRQSWFTSIGLYFPCSEGEASTCLL